MQLRAGFTLIELLFVVILGAILATITIPSIQQNMSYYRLSSSANLVASELNAARVLAVSRGALYQVNINTNARTLQVVDPADPSNPPRAPKTLERGVSFKTVPQTPITFYSRGNARSGAIELEGADDHEITIQVQASGQIRVREMDQ